MFNFHIKHQRNEVEEGGIERGKKLVIMRI